MTEQQLAAMKQALAYIEANTYGGDDAKQLMDALRTAIEQAEKQEPFGYVDPDSLVWKHRQSETVVKITRKPQIGYGFSHPVYSAQPAAQRQWVGLSEDEVAVLMMEAWGCASIAPQSAPKFARAIEAKLRAKNGFSCDATEKNGCKA